MSDFIFVNNKIISINHIVICEYIDTGTYKEIRLELDNGVIMSALDNRDPILFEGLLNWFKKTYRIMR